MTNNKLQSKINETQIGIEIAQAFVNKFQQYLPDSFPGSFYVSSKPAYTISLEYEEPEIRDQVLCHMGKTFGTSGWKASIAYGCRFYDWKKLVDGVEISISAAQKLESPETFSVDPRQFPLLIMDSIPTTSNSDPENIPF